MNFRKRGISIASSTSAELTSRKATEASLDNNTQEKQKRSLKSRSRRGNLVILLAGLLATLTLLAKVNIKEVFVADRYGSILRQRRSSQVGQGPPHFVTVVMPSVVNPNGRPKRLKAIVETWGKPARAVYVVHDTAEFPDAAQNILEAGTETAETGSFPKSDVYPQLLLIPPSISEEKGVQRLQYVIKAVSENINPDFAFFVNDHTFVIPEHLCDYLQKFDSEEDLYAGHAMRDRGDDYAFNSGAAGYVLSKTTMKNLEQKWFIEKDPECTAVNAPKFIQGNPGLVTARCLSHIMNLPAIDTRDESGRHRFHAFGLVREVTGKVDGWYKKKHETLDDILGVDPVHHHAIQNGTACCTPQTVSFHYVESFETKALFGVRKRLSENPDISNAELKDLIRGVWPSERHDIGGYAHGLPSDEESSTWEDLLKVMRMISPSRPSIAGVSNNNIGGAPC